MSNMKSEVLAGVSRRAFVLGGTSLAASMMTGCQTVATPPHPILDQTMSIDLHAHLSDSIRLGSLTGSQVSGVVNTVSVDSVIIGKRSNGSLYQKREPGKDELYKSTRRRLADGRRQMEAAGVSEVRTVAEIRAAYAARKKFAILGIEGGDFATEDPGRIQEMYEFGIRTIQPGHYTDGPFTDIQTSEFRHSGLSDRGREFIREMNRLGMLVDLAHMSFDASKQAMEFMTAPAMFSHGIISFDRGRIMRKTRVFGTHYAKMIAQSGGVLGMWPVIFGRGNFQSTLQQFAENTVRAIDLMGIDHVSVGTDMFGATLSLKSYRDWNSYVDVLGTLGVTRPDMEKLLSGNFMRIFAAATAKSA